MLNIKRWYLPQATLGELTVRDGVFKCFTLELPDNNNETNISCIPKGTYKASKVKSRKNGLCFELTDVPVRFYIQIHKGNWLHQTKGCILVGDSITNSHNGKMVTNSKKTLEHLLKILPEKFTVTIDE